MFCTIQQIEKYRLLVAFSLPCFSSASFGCGARTAGSVEIYKWGMDLNFFVLSVGPALNWSSYDCVPTKGVFQLHESLSGMEPTEVHERWGSNATAQEAKDAPAACSLHQKIHPQINTVMLKCRQGYRGPGLGHVFPP